MLQSLLVLHHLFSALLVCILFFTLIMCRNAKRHKRDCTFTNAIYLIVSRKLRVCSFFFSFLLCPTLYYFEGFWGFFVSWLAWFWFWFLLLSPSWMLWFCLVFLDSLGGGCLCYQNSYKWCLGSQLKLEGKKMWEMWMNDVELLSRKNCSSISGFNVHLITF